MATKHTLGHTEFTTPTDRELIATRTFDAPRQLLWDAHTKPQHVKQWMIGPEGWSMPVCELDLRPGGEWHFVWRRPGEPDMEMTGEFREVSPPDRLVQTERWGGDFPETLNTLVLAEDHGATTLTTTVRYASKDALDAAIATGMKDGWSESYDRLDEYLHRMS